MRGVVPIFLVFLLSMPPPVVAADAVILVVGDSLSAGYGIDPRRGWVALLQQRLQHRGLGYRVINAGITGDTSRGGRSRLPAALQRDQPAVVIIELGANDGLRGLDPSHTQANLRTMITDSRTAGAKVLLLGIKLPKNYGRAYGELFHQVYLNLADEEAVALVPFFLEGVAETRELMQADGIHPGEAAQPRVLDNVWPALDRLLAR
jgi:acyl-CoA thioesterase-1